jgi:hypothetical protein
MTFKKKLLLILAFIFISAIITVICTSLSKISSGKGENYDGTLVHMDVDFPSLI